MTGNRRPSSFVQGGMRALFVTALVTAGLAAWAAPAGACSCAGPGGPPPVLFEGRAVETVGQGAAGGELWAFEVSRGVRGDVSGGLVADVTLEPEPDTSGTVVVSSCALPVRVAAGATYEVGGYMGEAHDGTPRLFVNVCGGSVRQLEAAPATTGGAVPVEGTQSGGSSTGWRWVGLGLLSAAGVVAAGAYGIWRRRAAPVSSPG